MIISNCRRIVGGIGEGMVLCTTQPLNFLAMVNTQDGRITDPSHQLYGKSLKASVLFLPYAIGSSVGAYAFYSLKEYGNAPSAVVCSKVDITTASGCALANIPVVNLPTGIFLSTFKQGLKVRVDADTGTIIGSLQ
ncbi:MAG: aconitase X swivel domain-containing protein [Nitrososphaera sp.]